VYAGISIVGGFHDRSRFVLLLAVLILAAPAAAQAPAVTGKAAFER